MPQRIRQCHQLVRMLPLQSATLQLCHDAPSISATVLKTSLHSILIVNHLHKSSRCCSYASAVSDSLGSVKCTEVGFNILPDHDLHFLHGGWVIGLNKVLETHNIGVDGERFNLTWNQSRMQSCNTRSYDPVMQVTTWSGSLSPPPSVYDLLIALFTVAFAPPARVSWKSRGLQGLSSII